VRDGQAAVAQTLSFGCEPPMEILRVIDQVDRLALPDDHHGVREIDCERFAEPPKDGPAAPCRTESFHLTSHAPTGILTLLTPESIRRPKKMTNSTVNGVAFERRGGDCPTFCVWGRVGGWRLVGDAVSEVDLQGS